MGEVQRCRVLIVEDEAAISMLIEDMLLDLGVEIVGPASRLEAALMLACDADIEAAILDINVAGVHSYPVADVLRDRGVPVIFATGYGSSVLPKRFKHTQTLHKPFDQHQFAQALQTALAESPCEIEVA
ncbi:response regulator [Microvirga aerilata]|uniref:Response regulator n=1 Tax=Microvirga aerilata TaxID=670292 RepID=A0A936ZC56_9HYPH|nr:response regulator [Microvirga aerilata]MBL0407392.1 response regulator [Microvirga aerilata]